MVHRAILRALMTMLVLMFAACSRVPDIVRIGVAQPLSGPIQSHGLDVLEGVKLAVNDLNRRGVKIAGHPVKLEVVALDDKSDADTGKQVATELAEDGVVAAIADLNSGVSIAAAPIYAQRHIPQLAISTKPEFTQLGYPTTLRLVANDALQGKAMAWFATHAIKGSVYAVIDDGSSYGKPLADRAASLIAGQNHNVSLRRSIDDRTTDFSTLLPLLKQEKVDVIVTTLADFQVLALTEQLSRAGMTDLRILGGDSIKSNLLVRAPLPVKVFATSPIVEAREFPNGKAFLGKFRAAFGADPVYAAHYAYDAVWVLVAAMQRAESVNGEAVAQQLKHIDALAPVTNSIRFGNDGEQTYGAISVYEATPAGWEVQMRSDNW